MSGSRSSSSGSASSETTDSAGPASGSEASSDSDASSDATDPGFTAPAVLSSALAVGRFQRQAARLREQRQASLDRRQTAELSQVEASNDLNRDRDEDETTVDQQSVDGSTDNEDEDCGVVSDSDSEKTNPEFVLTPVFWKAVSKFKRNAARVREQRAAVEQAGVFVEATTEVMELGPELSFDEPHESEPETVLPEDTNPEPEPEPEFLSHAEPELEPESEPEPEQEQEPKPEPEPEPELEPKLENQPAELDKVPPWPSVAEVFEFPVRIDHRGSWRRATLLVKVAESVLCFVLKRKVRYSISLQNVPSKTLYKVMYLQDPDRPQIALENCTFPAMRTHGALDKSIVW
eukprot:COSAG02_NODE_8439_length_2569_cov_2.576518_1_plen_348_part_00